MEWIDTLPTGWRILVIVALAVVLHFVVRGLKRFSEWALGGKGSGGREAKSFMQRYPKVATVTTIFVSAFTFTVYFAAVGLILSEFGVNLKTYLASASVIGLAIGFGSQGLVQDVVIGLTLIFSDVLDVGDMVEMAGQIGRVDRIGLRFTVLVNYLGQQVFVPNRNIAQIGRYRGGYVRAYVDVQIPEEGEDEKVAGCLKPIALGMFEQHGSILLTRPEAFGVLEAPSGNWRFTRVKFRLWPGQGALIEQVFRQRALAALRKHYPDYPDWMITVTYRVDPGMIKIRGQAPSAELITP